MEVEFLKLLASTDMRFLYASQHFGTSNDGKLSFGRCQCQFQQNLKPRCSTRAGLPQSNLSALACHLEPYATFLIRGCLIIRTP